MASTLLAIDWCTAAVILVCFFTTASRNARAPRFGAQPFDAGPLSSGPTKEFRP